MREPPCRWMVVCGTQAVGVHDRTQAMEQAAQLSHEEDTFALICEVVAVVQPMGALKLRGGSVVASAVEPVALDPEEAEALQDAVTGLVEAIRSCGCPACTAKRNQTPGTREES